MIPLMGAVQGLAGIAGGIIGSGKRKREQREAQQEFDRNKSRMEGLDTSNLAVNQENTMEDLTVNTQQSDFINQQQQAGLANTMDKLSGAAGGSGIAALAQSLSQQQTANAQSASASIGQQEASNQMAERRMAGNLQSQELKGAYNSRAAEKDKTETMLGMSQQRLGAANAARDAATSSIIGGVSGAIGSVVPNLTGIADQKGDGSFIGNMLG